MPAKMRQCVCVRARARVCMRACVRVWVHVYMDSIDPERGAKRQMTDATLASTIPEPGRAFDHHCGCGAHDGQYGQANKAMLLTHTVNTQKPAHAWSRGGPQWARVSQPKTHASASPRSVPAGRPHRVQRRLTEVSTKVCGGRSRPARARNFASRSDLVCSVCFCLSKQLLKRKSALKGGTLTREFCAAGS